MIEIVRAEPPTPNLAAELAAAGLPPTYAWRPGFVRFPEIPDTDIAAVAAVAAVLDAHLPGDLEPMPPSLEERVTVLESKIAALESGG